METKQALAALAALSQESRLSVFRALVRAGREGLPAGAIADAVGAAASTLSFHLKELTHAGLVRSRQEGRFIFYTAEYDAMSDLIAFLTEKCCEGMPARNVARIGKAVSACCGPAAQPVKHRRSK